MGEKCQEVQASGYKISQSAQYGIKIHRVCQSHFVVLPKTLYNLFLIWWT